MMASACDDADVSFAPKLLQLPNELLVLILLNVDDSNHLLTRCPLVCSKFAAIIRSPGFWCRKFVAEFGRGPFARLSQLEGQRDVIAPDTTRAHLGILAKKCCRPLASLLFKPGQGLAFTRKLVVARHEYVALTLPRSIADFSKWIFAGGDGVSVVNPGFAELPSNSVSSIVLCVFDAISYRDEHHMTECLLVNLVKIGCPGEILDILRPPIVVSYMLANRIGTLNTIFPTLLDASGRVVATFDDRNVVSEGQVVFHDYPPGVRFAIFRRTSRATANELKLAPTLKISLVST